MTLSAIRENKILAKISEFTVYESFSQHSFLKVRCFKVQMLHSERDFLLTVKAAPHEFVIRTGQP